MAGGGGGSSWRRQDGIAGSLPGRTCGEVVADRDTLRLGELEEARARAAQMEKTMKWWSDCTANWRDKWSKVRNERNKTREEAKQLRSKLDAALKDVGTYKREKQELEVLNEQMRKELERIHLVLLKHAGQWCPTGCHRLLEALDNDAPIAEDLATDSERPDQDATDHDLTDNDTDHNVTEPTLAGTEPDSSSLTTPDQVKTWPVSSSPPSKETVVLDTRSERETLSNHQRVAIIQTKLDLANKTLQAEREEKTALVVRLERIESEAKTLRERCEELRASRQDAVRELLAMQDQHADTVALIRADLMDETNSREGMDRRLADLRAQVERLQGENAAEWGKREKAEAEKQAVERENKQLRADLLELHDRLDKKLRLASPSDSSYLHHQISEKTKEVLELKHSERKVRKQLGDKTSEASHMTRRCDQLEAEIRRLRARIDDLRRDLAVAEEEIDSATNNIRKMEEANDELQEQIQGLHVQMEGLHTSGNGNVSTTSVLSDDNSNITVSEEIS